MNGHVLIASVMLVSLFYLGQAFECYRCDLGFWDMCYTTETNCSQQQMCYVGIGKAVSVVDIMTKGCLNTNECNKTTVVQFPANKTLYSMTTTCCDEDLCNAGPAVQLSGVALLFPILLIAQMMGVF